MSRYILKRILGAIPMLIIVSILSFGIIKLAPGDPVMAYATPQMHKEDLDNLRKELGLDKPVYVQYGAWLSKTLKGDFGYSNVDFRPVKDKVIERMGATLILMGISMIISLILGIIFGVLSGYYENRWIDKVISVVSYIGISIPSFWFAMMLIVIFSVKLNLLPSIGMHSIGEDSLGDVIVHTIMPAMVLSFQSFAVIARYVRSNVIDEKDEEYVRTARGKGLSEKVIFGKHILKNSLIPIVTILGMSLPNLISGAFITETIFGWPGMGRLGIQAIFGFDYPVIMAITLLSSLFLIIGNLISDILYGVVDPRIKVVA